MKTCLPDVQVGFLSRRLVWKRCSSFSLLSSRLLMKRSQVNDKSVEKSPPAPRPLLPTALCPRGMELMGWFQGPDAHQCYGWLVVIQIATQGAQAISPAASVASCLPRFWLISPPVAPPWHHGFCSSAVFSLVTKHWQNKVKGKKRFYRFLFFWLWISGYQNLEVLSDEQERMLGEERWKSMTEKTSRTTSWWWQLVLFSPLTHSESGLRVSNPTQQLCGKSEPTEKWGFVPADWKPVCSLCCEIIFLVWRLIPPKFCLLASLPHYFSDRKKKRLTAN